MTADQIERILANPQDYDPKYVEEAKKLKQEKIVSKDNMSDETAERILANESDYDPKYVEIAKSKKNIKNAGYSAPGKEWVKQYIPVNENGGFNFNWKQAYDQKVNPEDLKSLEKLDEFRRSKMWSVDDDVNLDNVATELHFKQADESWSDFMSSDRFKEFQNYLSDVRANQQKEAVDKIFDEDGSLLVDFMLPVSKEYAKRNYQDINGLSDLAGPLAADAGTNLVMTGVGKGAMATRPLLSHIYGNAVAPVITEAGNVAFNDKPVKKAGINALEGYLVNRQTGKVLNKYLPSLENWAGGKVAERQSVINEAVNAAENVSDKMKRGATTIVKDAEGNNVYLKWTKKGPKKLTEAEFDRDKAPHISSDEWNNWVQTRESVRSLPTISDIYQSIKTPKVVKEASKRVQNANKQARNALYGDEVEAAKRVVIDKIRVGEKPTFSELKAAGMSDKESITNFLSRLSNNSINDYLTNAAGRPKFGQKGLGSFLETMIPGLDLFKDETEKEKKSRLRKMYGL